MSLFQFEHSYTTLPNLFFNQQRPTPVRNPKLVIFNHKLAQELELKSESFSENFLVDILSGNQILPQSMPIAQAYMGHQFGHLARLGDGRAILLGEHTLHNKTRFDIQLKGPGRTPFSRQGDGRAALGPMLREYLISEAMYALGIPTTRSLAVVTTGEPVYRNTVLQGAILTRVAKSHIRIGTFEYAALLEDPTALKALADYTIQRHYPYLEPSESIYDAFLAAVIDRQAFLVAQWMLIGFVHGVLNTDNISIAGETLDYGPCAFMDTFDENTVFSSIDHFGRYAYGQQPSILSWNLSRFAETLLPLLHPQPEEALQIATNKINAFSSQFSHYFISGMQAKLGLITQKNEDEALIGSFFTLLKSKKQDYTTAFHHLLEANPGGCFQTEEGSHWLKAWKIRLSQQSHTWTEVAATMQKVNPLVIPRNYHVEAALQAAEAGDYQPYNTLLQVLQHPYDTLPDTHLFIGPGPIHQEPYRTFCGT